MAKSTKAGGPSLTEHELSDPTPPERNFVITRPMLGEVDRPIPEISSEEDVETEEEIETEEEEDESLVGANSSQSSESESRESDSESPSLPLPVLTTENPSEAPEKVTGSTARSTATGGRRKPPAPSARRQTGGKARARFEPAENDGLDEFDDLN